MKTSAEYLAAHVFEARRPHRPLQPVVALPDAVAALEQALADAEKYRYLLMRALRRNAAEALAPAGKVLPLYPEQPAAELRLAA